MIEQNFLWGMVFLAIGIIVLLKNIIWKTNYNFYWFCDFAPFILSAGFFLQNYSLIRGVVNVGFIAQLITAILLIIGLFKGSVSIMNTSKLSKFYLFAEILIHVAPVNLAYLLIYPLKPDPFSLAYSLAIIALMFFFTLFFTSKERNVNLLYHLDIDYHGSPLKFYLPLQTKLWIFYMLVISIFTFWIQTLIWGWTFEPAAGLSITELFNITTEHGSLATYGILFLLMVFEGPIVTALAGFLASQGYLSIWIICLIAIFGSVIPDTLLYLLGRRLRNKSIETILKSFGLNKKKISWLEKNLKNHAVKSIILIKLIPPLPVPGLILAGFMKINFKKFLLSQVAINVSGPIIFAGIGFYLGTLTGNAVNYLKYAGLLFPVLAVFITLIYLLNRYIVRHIVKILKT